MNSTAQSTVSLWVSYLLECRQENKFERQEDLNLLSLLVACIGSRSFHKKMKTIPNNQDRYSWMVGIVPPLDSLSTEPWLILGLQWSRPSLSAAEHHLFLPFFPPLLTPPAFPDSCLRQTHQGAQGLGHFGVDLAIHWETSKWCVKTMFIVSKLCTITYPLDF